MIGLMALIACCVAPVTATDKIKIGYIATISGPAASLGRVFADRKYTATLGAGSSRVLPAGGHAVPMARAAHPARPAAPPERPATRWSAV